MAYMVYQRVATAIRDAYHGSPGPRLEDGLAEARRARAWLESLDIDPTLRASLVEPIAVVEDTFRELQAAAGRDTGDVPPAAGDDESPVTGSSRVTRPVAGEG